MGIGAPRIQGKPRHGALRVGINGIDGSGVAGAAQVGVALNG